MAVSWLDVKHRCKDVTRLVSLAQDVRLPWHRRLKVRLHLSVCAACARFEAQVRFLREAARRYKS